MCRGKFVISKTNINILLQDYKSFNFHLCKRVSFWSYLSVALISSLITLPAISLVMQRKRIAATQVAYIEWIKFY